jgi:hypothetical protein
MGGITVSHDTLAPVELGEFKITAPDQGFFQTGINALGAIDAPAQIECRFKFFVAGLRNLEGAGGTIAHAHLAPDAFFGIKDNLAPEILRHRPFNEGITCRRGLDKNMPQDEPDHLADPCLFHPVRPPENKNIQQSLSHSQQHALDGTKTFRARSNGTHLTKNPFNVRFKST